MTDQIGVGTIILGVMGLMLAVPASYVGWHTVKSLRTTEEAERIGRVVNEQLKKVLHQITPSNGRTTANHVEEIERKLDDNKREYTDAIRIAVDTITKIGNALQAHLDGHHD